MTELFDPLAPCWCLSPNIFLVSPLTFTTVKFKTKRQIPETMLLKSLEYRSCVGCVLVEMEPVFRL